MPVALVDPTVQASGSLPASPVGNMLAQAVGVYGRNIPTPVERAEMALQNAQTQRVQQQTGASTNFGNLVDSIYNPQSSAAPAGGTDANGNPTPAPPPVDVNTALHQKAGQLFANAMALDPSAAPALYRAVVANAPGVTTAAPIGQLSPVDAAQIGSGEGIDATMAGRQMRQIMPTDEMRNRNFKIQQIISSQGLDPNNPDSYKQAAAVADGLVHVVVDPNSKTTFLVNDIDRTSIPLHSPAQTIGAGGQVSPMAGQGGAPPAAPPGGPPFNPALNNGPSTSSPQAMAGSPPGAVGQEPTSLDDVLTMAQNMQRQARGGAAPAAAPAMPVVPSAPAMPVVPSAPANAPDAGAPFALSRGDLGVPFDQIYGGPQVANRMLGGVGAAFGNPEANNAPVTGLSKLNDIVSRMVAIKGLQPGNRGSVAAMSRIEKQFPPTDPSLLDEGALAGSATYGAGTAEDQTNARLSEAVADRINDARNIADPNLDATERSFTQQRINKMDSLVGALPQGVQQKYVMALKAAGVPVPQNIGAPPAQSNYQKGMQATTPGAKVKVVSPSGQTGSIDPSELSSALANGWKQQ